MTPRVLARETGRAGLPLAEMGNPGEEQPGGEGVVVNQKLVSGYVRFGVSVRHPGCQAGCCTSETGTRGRGLGWRKKLGCRQQ